MLGDTLNVTLEILASLSGLNWLEGLRAGYGRGIYIAILFRLEPRKRAHSPLLAAGLASESENEKLPYGAASHGELSIWYVL